MKSSMWSFLFFVCAIAGIASPVKAGLILEFGDINGTTVSNYSMGIGGTADVYVYLAETDSLSPTVPNGLFAAGFQLKYTGDDSVVESVTVANVLIDPIFDQSNTPEVVGSSSSIHIDLATSSLTVGTVPGRISLAKVTFTGKAEGVSNLSFQDLTDGANWLDWLAIELDGNVNFSNAATLTITAVPEPSSLALVISLLSLTGWRHRRQQS